jgi:transcription factor IIIB subunit 2
MIAQFTKLSGGLEGGADPPAFQRAEKQRLEAAERAEEAVAVKEAALEESICDTQHSDADNPKKVIVVFFGGGGGHLWRYLLFLQVCLGK